MFRPRVGSPPPIGVSRNFCRHMFADWYNYPNHGLPQTMSVYRLISPALLLLLLLQPLYAAEPRETKRVLVLYSDDENHPAHQMTQQGIRAAFGSNKLFDVQLYTEYLDVTRFGGFPHARAMADLLRSKYSGMEIHAIIAVYPYAADFLLAERRTLFPGVPIVAAELTSRSDAENLERSPVRRFVTGTVIGDNITGVMAEALRMRPQTKRVALVAGTAPNDAQSEQVFRRWLRPYAGRIELIDLTKLSMEETLSRVGSLPPDTLVYYTSFFRGGAGKSFVPPEALSLIARTAKVPVFGLYESYLGFGIVGGRLVSFEEQGKEAAALALRIMGGESPASIPFGGEQAYVTAYDWRELKRWGIKEESLPPGSIVKYKEFSVWDLYRWYIIGGILFMVLETIVVVLLVVLTRKLKRAHDKYRNIFEGSVEGIFEASPQGRPLTANSALARMLGYASPDEFTSSMRDVRNQVWANPDERAEYIRLLEKQDVTLGFECQFLRKDGTKIWVSVSSRRVCGRDGKTVFYSGFMQDITERKRAQPEAVGAHAELLRAEGSS